MSTDNAPSDMAQAIAHLEAEVARVRTDWPEFEPNEPFLQGPEDVLDALVSFISSYPDVIAEKGTVTLFAAGAGSVLGVWLRCKRAAAAAAVALAAFCRARKCAISVKVKGVTITAEAPTIDELERLLRVTYELYIHPAKPNDNRRALK